MQPEADADAERPTQNRKAGQIETRCADREKEADKQNRMIRSYFKIRLISVINLESIEYVPSHETTSVVCDFYTIRLKECRMLNINTVGRRMISMMA